ncbi:MAG: uncharacterized protein JWN98_1797 [Abditibacteriota bacterium]|nr:uncharacterized protein [Abditibacteriota bacterium]
MCESAINLLDRATNFVEVSMDHNTRPKAVNHKYTNALAQEKSPYLLQHAHNPVDWLPWSEAAFERARREEKPIFLSIGYSTCHWCHVMERESFENESVAAIMNANFINIKVDREERPDVDRVYMTFVQATNNGQGGWPLSAFLTPQLEPFYGGTYYPPRDAYGRPGFTTLLNHIAQVWKENREEIEASGQHIVSQMQEFTNVAAQPGSIDWPKVLQTGYEQFVSSFDPQWGGFGDAPKFPRPVAHDFLHRFQALTHDEAALKMSVRTLRAMGDGGMHDHLGGGFHRYAVDEMWIVSHFEKMLYDQAQLAVSFSEAQQLTGQKYFGSVARDTCDYVLHDLRHPNGGFFSAEDADSFAQEGDAHEGDAHKEEGAFYVWTAQELESTLGADAAAIWNYHYGVQPEGNAPRQGDPHGEFKGKNILFAARPLENVEQQFGRSVEQIEQLLEEAKQKVLVARGARPRPHRDDKIIVSWNGLMISALARTGSVLNEPKYLAAARSAAGFIRTELFDTDQGTLKRHWKDGAAEVAAFADDYAALSRGLLDLYEVTGEVEWLQWAETLMATLDRDFWDSVAGGYFNSSPDPRVLLRMKEDYDGAEPSANSLATQNNLRLANLLESEAHRERALQTLQLFGGRLQQTPSAMPAMLVAQMMAQTPPQHIVLVGEREADDTKVLWAAVRERFLPFASVILLDEASRKYFEARLPFVAPMQAIEGRATAYVCRDFACRQPTNNVDELAAQLDE